MDRLFAAAAAKSAKPPRRKPRPVYKVKNPRPFPPGRLELVIGEQRSSVGRDVLISPLSTDGLPVLPVHADIRIYAPQEDFFVDDHREWKTIGWIDGWIVQTGRIINEGFDFHNVCDRVTDEVAAMSLQLFDKYGHFIDPEDGAPGFDERGGDILYIESVFLSSRYRGYGLSLLAVSHLIDQLPSFQGDLILLSPGPLNPHYLPKPKLKGKPNAKPQTTTGYKSDAKSKSRRHSGQASGTDKKPSSSTSASAAGPGATGQATKSKSQSSASAKPTPAPPPKVKRTKEERLAARAKACDRISAHWELMGFSRYTTEKQEKSEDGIPIWGMSTAYQNPPIESIVPHLFVRPSRNASTKSAAPAHDDEEDVGEEEDLGLKGGWASDSDEAESSFETIDWDRARKKQMENMKKMLRWTPYLRDDDPEEKSKDPFGLPTPPAPVLEMMDLFREAIFNGLYPSNSKTARPPAPASKMGPSIDKRDNTTTTKSTGTGVKTNAASPPLAKNNTNTATKTKTRVDKLDSSHDRDRDRDRPGLGIDNGAKAGPSKLRA